MEALRGSGCNRSCDLGLGVKSPSSPVIAGSCRNWPQSSLKLDCLRGRGTDWGFRDRKVSTPCPTPNAQALHLGRRGAWVSCASERGTTQTAGKGPKY